MTCVTISWLGFVLLSALSAMLMLSAFWFKLFLLFRLLTLLTRVLTTLNMERRRAIRLNVLMEVYPL